MILVLGGSGYIASAFTARLIAGNIPHLVVSRQSVNYSDRDRLIALIRQTRASFLINAAGYTGKPNVDACESHKPECLLGNAVLPGIIRQACEHCELPWGHVSSGCIYSGDNNGRGFAESDQPNFCFRSPPCSFYSGCKALGEECLAGSDNHYNWRLRIPFDETDSERNYLSKLMRYERLLDVRNSISQLAEYVNACLECWNNHVEFGTYHVTNSGSVTTREIIALIQKSGVCNRDFQFFPSEEEFMRTAASTPRSSCTLDNSKLLATGIHMSPVVEAIERSLKNWKR